MYDFPERKRTEYTEMEVVGRAEVHGIEGVEVVAMQFDPADYYRTGALDRVERRFVAQLTDTHSRYLAETHMEDGVRKCYTFLDGEAFLNNWGFGEDNCGNEVNLHPKGLLHREGNCVTGSIPREVVDVVGRYRVTIGGKPYDTVCVMDIECYNDAVASEQYVDQNGRTVLWRRFNRDDWAIEHYGQKWSEQLPDNERITINGERKETIERVFADAKEQHGMRYTRYTGLAQVTNWVKLKFAAINLKKFAKWSWRDARSNYTFSIISFFFSQYVTNPCFA